ncbi:MAG: lipid A-modifier LpxR family protein [Paracoccaceae bacterium]
MGFRLFSAIRALTLPILTLAALSQPFAATAEIGGRERIGAGRLFSNDAFGDGQDRWRTGAYSLSHLRGYGWDGLRPQRFGDIVEYRFRSEIIAPADITAPAAAPTNRPYLGAMSFGLHSHWRNGATEFSGGAEVIVTGPQTGLSKFQTAAHKAFGLPAPGDLSGQIANGIHPNLVLEAGQAMQISPQFLLRPFVEVKAGPEVLARVGGDLIIGRAVQNQLMIRDATTGQLYQGTRKDPNRGFSFVLGGDVAHVAQSKWLPESSGFALTDARTRLRTGVHYQGNKSAGFLGLSYLGPEFQGQPSGQIVGSLRLRLRF